MIAGILKNNKTKAHYYGYRPDEIKQEEVFCDGNINFCMISPVPQNVLAFSIGADIIFNMLRRRKNVYADMGVLPDKNLLSRMGNAPIEALYSERQIRDFDIIGLSLYFIGSYFNVVPFLIKSGINPIARERGEEDPLIIAGGGSCSTNPLPVSDFIDVFVIGDGETPVKNIIDCMEENKGVGKMELLHKLKEKNRSLYIPLLAKNGESVYYNIEEDISGSILDASDYVSKPRNKTIELIRGCRYKCNFCNLGNIRRKVAEMPVESVVKAIKSYPTGTSIYPFAPDESSYRKYDEIYKNIGDRKLYRYNQRFNTYKKNKRHSLNDYRVSFGLDGISQRIRDLVRKNVKEQQVREAITHALANFDVIKINLIIAFPFECHSDWEEFERLMEDICKIRKELVPEKCYTEEENERVYIGYKEGKKVKIDKKLLMLHLAPTPFQAEPHTPMQWYGIGDIDLANIKIKSLKKKLLRKYGMVKTEGLNSKASMETEFIMKRGGKEICNVLYDMGKRDYYNSSGLSQLNKPFKLLLKKRGIDYRKYLKEYSINDSLPWEFIVTGGEERYKREYLKMKANER